MQNQESPKTEEQKAKDPGSNIRDEGQGLNNQIDVKKEDFEIPSIKKLDE
jgi:hypothetical protein